MSDRIKKLCKIIGRDLATLHKGDTASALWPFTPNELEHYIGDFFIKDLHDTISKLEGEGYNKEEISKLLGYPSKISAYFMFFHSAESLSKNKRIYLADRLLDYIGYYRKDALCKDRINPLYKERFEDKFISSNVYEDEEMVNLGDKLSASLLMYLEILFPTMMRLGHEFHGPYKNKDDLFFVKDFYNLKPQKSEIAEEFPFNRIVITEKINERPKVDFFNHIIDTPQKSGVNIWIDDKKMGVEEVKEKINKIQEVLGEISSMREHNKKSYLLNASLGLLESFQPLREKIGKELKIPEKIKDEIGTGNFSMDIEKIKEFHESHSREELEKIISKSYLDIF